MRLVTRRGAAAALPAALLAGVLAGCTGTGPVGQSARSNQASGQASGRAAPPPGCGMTAPRLLTGLLGPAARSAAHGGLTALRRDGTAATCVTTTSTDAPGSTGGTGTRARRVTVRVVRHPAPLTLPSLDCDQGWVYAGSPEKYVPACQQGRGRGGRTLLLARWGDYVVRVDIVRANRAWGGDAELGLALSHDVARRLGAASGNDGGTGQSASGSSS